MMMARMTEFIFDSPFAAGCRVFVMEADMVAVKAAHALKSVRAAYDFDTGDFDPGINCQEYVDPVTGELVETPSMTRQADAEDCDINVMMARYQKTGELPPLNRRSPISGDFSTVVDFHSALNLVTAAQQDFMTLPAEMRARFGNDPGALLRFLDDPANADEAVRLGLIPAPAEEVGGAGGSPPAEGSQAGDQPAP